MRMGTKFGDVSLTDTMMKDGLTDAFNNYHMGITGKISNLLYIFSLDEFISIIELGPSKAKVTFRRLPLLTKKSVHISKIET